MPVEIKQLIIKATVEEPVNTAPAAGGNIDPIREEALIEACVKQVLRILKKMKER